MRNRSQHEDDKWEESSLGKSGGGLDRIRAQNPENPGKRFDRGKAQHKPTKELGWRLVILKEGVPLAKPKEIESKSNKGSA